MARSRLASLHVNYVGVALAHARAILTTQTSTASADVTQRRLAPFKVSDRGTTVFSTERSPNVPAGARRFTSSSAEMLLLLPSTEPPSTEPPPMPASVSPAACKKATQGQRATKGAI
eukprot:6193252-Pleurochrysis_carterae.AAC.3